MKKLFLALTTLLTASIFVQGVDAQETERSGFYVGGRVFNAEAEVNGGTAQSAGLNAVNSGAISNINLNVDTKSIGAGIVFGKKINDFSSVELFIGYADPVSISGSFDLFGSAVFTNQDLEILPVIVSYQGRYSINDYFGIYGGVGAGAVFGQYDVNANGNSVSSEDITFALTGNIGAFAKLNDQISIKGGYRYFHMKDLDFDINGTTIEIGLKESMWEAGIEYEF
jgi:opacity protein-like surface antigen